MSRVMHGAARAAVLAVVTGLALVPAGASAQSNLLPNPTFAGGTTSGWKATNAKLSVVSPGNTGFTYAGRAARTTGTSYSMYASPKPATGVAQGTQFQGTGEVLGVAGRSVCLVLQESTAAGTAVQSQQQCVKASGGWQAFSTTNLTTRTAGDSVGFMIRQTGAKTGDGFEADNLSLTESSSSPPPAGAAGWWPMNETSGTTVHDISGNGNSGTIQGPVQVGVPGPGSPGYSTTYKFSGHSDVDVPYSPTLVAGSANITISFYLNTTSVPKTGDYDLVRMGVYPFEEYKVELEQNGEIQCTFHGSSGSNFAEAGPDVADGSWHSVECVKTATQVQLWVDGTQVATTNAAVGSVSPSQDVTIGSHGTPGYDWYQGELGDAKISFG